jgi:hypothetical protein
VAFGVLASYFRRLVFARDLPPWVVQSARLTSLAHAGEKGAEPRE